MTVADEGRSVLRAGLGRAVRSRRLARGLTLRALAAASGLSERFLVQVEGGEANISVARLASLAEALESTGSALLQEAEQGLGPGEVAHGVVALLGLRGAGKSTVGQRAARRLGVPFVELDARVEQRAGMRLGTLFEVHGTAHYRRLEREVLGDTLEEFPRAVVATGGSIVTDPETWALLAARTTTVWLQASADDHWARVVAQGDARPMAHRADARRELQQLLNARAPLYARARWSLDTSALGLRGTVDALVEALRR